MILTLLLTTMVSIGDGVSTSRPVVHVPDSPTVTAPVTATAARAATLNADTTVPPVMAPPGMVQELRALGQALGLLP
jgi:hypothetical protein